MKISEKEITHLAWLSRLGMDEKEMHRLNHDCEGVLEYVGQLGEADVEGIEPTAQVTGLVNVGRSDAVHACENPEEIIACAPTTQGRHIKVSSILE